ncbi:stress responsive alpha/beta barrel protein [Shimia isoporae]|uniref:Stress responsive alpha/beta barrel protein n=1 Tax=Shimia isoporae TaxID=647720 RepID=A0A4R1N2N3_9RHOB|nr:Dabb family protein [Shimia isoporae]TCL00488.1 stress responsive alpha/beta barrel protein [Shimia isoporae]
MIRHIVMLNLRPHVQAPLDVVLAKLAELVDTLDGCSNFVAGPNRDFEAKSQDFPHGFMFDAESAEALAAYAEHPEHIALGSRLVAMCNGGGKGITVFDLEIPSSG